MKKICIFLLMMLILPETGALSADEGSLLPRLAEWKAGAGQEEAKLALLLEKSLQAYGTVKDYKATFKKQEGSAGKLDPQETIFLKFEKPFKIFMRWMDTHKSGLQVLYERGKHGGKLGIHKPGLLLGLAPVVFLDQNSPWVREGSASYNIEDAGIGTFLYDFTEMVLKGAAEKKLAVAFENDSTAAVSFPGTAADEKGYFAYKVIVTFDEKTGLPVHMELFDWENRHTGIYDYQDLSLNVGAEDPEFKKLAQPRLYKLYLPAPAPPVRSDMKTNFGPSARRS